MTDVPLLVVASGLQKGAKVPLPRGESRIGSDPECAVVVIDPTLEACHLRVAVDDVVQLRCDFPIVLSDGTEIAPGGVLDIPATCRFTAGSTEFELALPALPPAPAPSIRPLPRRLVAAAGGLTALGGSVLVAATVMHGHGAALTSDEPPVSTRRTQPNSSGADAAIAFLRQQIGAAGLALKVTEQPDGGIAVAGTVPAGRNSEWEAIRWQYDQRFAMSHVLVERLAAEDEQPHLRLAAVWSGPDSYVVDEHGERLRIGASIGDGWSIDSIDGEQVVIRLGSRKVALRY
jgi:hypothetical protein